MEALVLPRTTNFSRWAERLNSIVAKGVETASQFGFLEA
jgi:hypothetical protein